MPQGYPTPHAREIAEAFAAGKSLDEIAATYKCRRKTIYGIRARFGVPARPVRRGRRKGDTYKLTQAQRDEIVRRYGAGESAIMLAHEFRCTSQWVWKLRDNHRRLGGRPHGVRSSDRAGVSEARPGPAAR